jgi:3-hydroxybutyrate dehydrogenase
MDIQEPEVTIDQILIIKDTYFNQGNVCIVSGCAAGIGRACCVAAAANQISVFGLDVNDQEAEKTRELARAVGGQMEYLHTDLCQDADIEAAVARAAKLGAVKFLLNIAGLQHIDSVENFPMEKYDLMQRIMLRAPFYLSKLAIPQMRKSKGGTGVIGNMASVHGHICTVNKPVYNITKFGLRALSQSISAEGEGKIRSFTLSTGFVKTPLALNQIPAQAKQRGITPEEVVRDVMMGKSRVKEMMAPIEVANLFIFGLSHHSNYLVGGDMLFDGGMVLTY